MSTPFSQTGTYFWPTPSSQRSTANRAPDLMNGQDRPSIRLRVGHIAVGGVFRHLNATSLMILHNQVWYTSPGRVSDGPVLALVWNGNDLSVGSGLYTVGACKLAGVVVTDDLAPAAPFQYSAQKSQGFIAPSLPLQSLACSGWESHFTGSQEDPSPHFKAYVQGRLLWGSEHGPPLHGELRAGGMA